MANTCTTDYICVGNEKDIESLHKLITDFHKKEHNPSEWNVWHLVAETDGKATAESLYLRGDVGTSEMESPTRLAFSCWSAWAELPDFRKWIEQRYPSIKMYYYAEEFDNEYFATNDINHDYFTWKYVMNCQIEECDCSYDYYDNLTRLSADVSRFIGQPVPPSISDIQSACERYNDTHRETREYISVYEVKIEID